MSLTLIAVTVVWFLLILSFLVFIHEFGHFLAARLVGVFVEEFGLGYPPLVRRLFSWKGTVFTLNALPFGGFVRLYGDESENLEAENPDSINELVVKHKVSEQSKFASKSIGKRLFILLAGISVNFLFGALAFAYIYSRIGIPTPTGKVEISEVVENSPAKAAGFQLGDRIVAAQADPDKEFTSSNQFIYFISQHQGETVEVVLEREAQQQIASVYIRTPEETGPNEGAVGLLLSDNELKFYPWWQMPFRGMGVGFQEAFGLALLIVDALKQMLADLFLRGTVPKDVSGFVGIVDQAVQVEAVKQGFMSNLNTAALLSINLAIMNLLPIPALDGGRAVFVLAEPLLGKKRRARWEQKANTVGFVFLLGLIVLITLKDIVGIIL